MVDVAFHPNHQDPAQPAAATKTNNKNAEGAKKSILDADEHGWDGTDFAAAKVRTIPPAPFFTQ